MRILTFDLEIKKAIQSKGEPKQTGIEYCDGWGDYNGMGISIACAYLDWEKRYKFYDEDNLDDLIADFAQADLITGYNIFGFDVPLLKATLVKRGFPEKTGMAGKCYDIFGDIKKSTDAKGCTLDNIVKATLNKGKSGEGKDAPALYQRGRFALLSSYVCRDVQLEHELFIYAQVTGEVEHPEKGTIYLKKIIQYQHKEEQHE